MKHSKRLPIPQGEFGFMPNALNLFQERTADGERVAREQEQAERARQSLEKAQATLLQIVS